MKQLNTIVLLTVVIVLTGCFSNEKSTVTKKDDPTQREYAYKRLNGVGRKRRYLVLIKKYYSVSVTVNEKGEIQKDVDFSKSNTYEETTL